MKPEYQPMWENYRGLLPAKSRDWYSSLLRRFLDWAGSRELNEKTVLRYLDHLRKGGYADGTVKMHFSIIQRFAKVNGIAWQFRRDERPVVRESEVHNYAMSVDDIRMMVEVCRGERDPLGDLKPQPYHTAFLCLSTVYWMRPIEIRVMTVEDLDLANQMIYVNTAKYGRQRYHRIPDFVIPFLETWSFKRHPSQFAMSKAFMDLRTMIDFQVYGIGWHAIRRAALKEADKVGMTTAQKNIFGRWTVGSSQQAVRYSMAKTVSRGGDVVSLGIEDQEVDDLVYSKHPFVQMWR